MSTKFLESGSSLNNFNNFKHFNNFEGSFFKKFWTFKKEINTKKIKKIIILLVENDALKSKEKHSRNKRNFHSATTTFNLRFIIWDLYITFRLFSKQHFAMPKKFVNQRSFTCLKSTMETSEQCLKSVQSQQ